MRSETKNICLFNSCKNWGGGEKWHFETALRLSDSNYNLIICTNAKSELYQKLSSTKIPRYRFGITNLSFLNLFLIYKLVKLFKSEKVYTIILGLPSDVKAAGIAAKIAGVKNIIYRRGTALPIRNSILNRYLFKHVITRVLANSGEIKKKFFEKNSALINIDKIQVLYNGVKVNGISFPDRNTKSEVIIGNAGRLVEQKGQIFLISLAKELSNRNVNYKILIAGKGPLKKFLIEHAVKNKVIERIVFLDFVENIESFLDKIDIFVLPSIHEGSANVLIEAMAKAKPVVAFNTSSLPEIISHGETGFLAELGNIQQLSDYVCELAEDIELRKKIGLNAYRDISERFNATTQFEKLLTLLN